MRERLSTPAALRLVLVVAALGLGGLGQLLVGADNLRWSAAFYVVAAAAMALAVTNRPVSRHLFVWKERYGSCKPPDAGSSDSLTARRVVPDRKTRVGERWLEERRLGLGCFAASALLLAVSLRLFPAGPSYAVAWLSYGSSMLLLLVALPSLDGRWTALAGRLGQGTNGSWHLRAAIPWCVLVAILALAFAVRVYHLDSLPAGLWFDEADNLAQARLIQRDPGATPVYVPSTNLPSLYLMPIAAVVDLTGVTVTSGRIVSVAFGLAGVVVVFLLVRLILAPSLALVAAFVYAVSRWEINWSRIGMHGVTAPLFAALTAYLTLRALRSGRVADYGFAGGALGLSLWFYASLRFLPLVLGFMLLHHLVFQRPAARTFLARVLVMVAVMLAVAAPVFQSAIVDSDEFFARTRVTSVFSVMSFGDAIGEVWGSLGAHALMFNDRGDPNPRHNLPDTPMLDFMSGVLLVLGLGVALANWRNLALVSLPFWVFFMVLPGVLTLPWEAPQSLRSVGAIPAVVILVTLSVGAVWTVGRSAPWPAVRRGTPAIVLAALGGIAYLNINTYFGPQASHPQVYASFSTVETLLARHMLEQQRRGHSLFVSRQFKHGLSTALLANEPRYDVIRAPTGIPINPDNVWLGASIYLEPREGSVYRLLQAYYPDARFEVVRPPGGGDVLYYSAVLSRAQLEDPRGLVARSSRADGTVRETLVSSTEVIWLPKIQAVPFDLVWEGALHIVEPGSYVLALDGSVEAEVFLDGRRILDGRRTSVRIEPAVGLHALTVTARVEDVPGFLRLSWQPPGGEMSPIGLENLFHGTVRPVGLAGRFYPGGAESESPEAMRVTPAVDVFYYDPVIPEPYLAVWEGHIDVEVGGIYRFRAIGAGVVRVFIDDELIAHTPESDSVESGAELTLMRGNHPFRVEYLSQAPPSELEVFWAPPGRGLEPIPIDRLSPAAEHMFRIVPSDE